MKCEILSVKGTWKEVYDAALTTEGKESVKEPSSRWRYRILKAEHSPIRLLRIKFIWYDMPYWVMNHIRTHYVGLWGTDTDHFAKTSRTDRTGVDRNKLYQDEPVNYMIEANSQAIINISRKRLCRLASPETRLAWQIFVTELSKVEPELADCCLPNCEYQGKCWEIKPCTTK